MFEKGPVPGGKLLTEEVDGYTVEAGPDSFLPEKIWTLDLIRKIGLEDQLLGTNEEHKGTYIFSRGRLHRLPEGVMLMVPTMIMPLVRSSLISLPGKIRMGMELFVPRKSDGADESLARFVTRRLGRECLEKIAEPLVAGIHTSNPDNMSVKAIFPRFLEMEQKHGSLIRGMVRAMKTAHRPTGNGKQLTYFMSLRRGMQQLVDGCVGFAGKDVIHTSSEVKQVLRGTTGYNLAVGRSTIPFDAVVLATPSYVTKELVRDMAPLLSERLSPIEWSSTATISLAFNRGDINADLPGFGFIVPKTEKRRINAATWSSLKWSFRSPPDRLLVRCFVGGGHHEELVSCDDSDLLSLILDELKQIAGIDAPPLFSKVYRWMKSMPRYTVGHLDRVAAIDEAASAFPGLCLIGCSYRGIGIGDCVKSGFDAADRIEQFTKTRA
ncbi:MAG: Protoporphyrinogen oxidase [Syntrophorhabdaceae bacterium PtaU1.Bin034]|nr:MAG: Protoporphyrinogen oxidase [Syntrophorhabdaceae bacterium PtaU1.Bin034]